MNEPNYIPNPEKGLRDVDIVEFIETVCNVDLLESQKETIRKLYEAGPDAKIIFPYRSGYNNYRHLADMAKMLYVDLDRNTEIFKGE